MGIHTLLREVFWRYQTRMKFQTTLLCFHLERSAAENLATIENMQKPNSMIIIFLSKSFTAISFIATSSRFHIIGPNTNMLCLKGDYSSQLDSLAGEILEQRKRLKNEGKPHAQSDVFFAVKEFFRSHLLSALSPDKVDKPTQCWVICRAICLTS